MEGPSPGTVTSFASMFPFNEAQNAARRVEESIAEKQKELSRLGEFIAENNDLINLVSKLPDELDHDVMVPFGKAAFFPGRLIHTNEFLVLLGESYFVERTAKQTIDILKRRGTALDSQVESLKKNIDDLKAEASFFGATASESMEGLVEIREDYVDEAPKEEGPYEEKHFESADKENPIEDAEYARIMSRLDELEKEELAAQLSDEMFEDDRADPIVCDDQHAEEQSPTCESDTNSHGCMKAKEMKAGLVVQPSCHDIKGLAEDVRKVSFAAESAFVLPDVRENLVAFTSKNEAFTGSVVERMHDNQTQEQIASQLQAKPISRFKMNRRR